MGACVGPEQRVPRCRLHHGCNAASGWRLFRLLIQLDRHVPAVQSVRLQPEKPEFASHRVRSLMRRTGVVCVNSALAERLTGGRYADIDIDRAAASRYGLNIADVQSVIASAVGGKTIGETVEGLARFPIQRALSEGTARFHRESAAASHSHRQGTADCADGVRGPQRVRAGAGIDSETDPSLEPEPAQTPRRSHSEYE
jgi:hypothetical protein